jgi:DNA-binding SARP family transcriptional activator
MWPDLDPELGSNSLNQTVYFLRRVFEPNYREETSPAYLQSDSEMLWLDRDLVDSRSAACVALLRRARARDESSVDELAGTYRGRFALDFAYEEWAAIHRDSMHAGYLEVMERAILARSDRGDLDGAIRLARAVVDTDPSADSVEVALIRLYRLTGSHAAAAEQYAHYSSAQRSELGVDVPALMDL